MNTLQLFTRLGLSENAAKTYGGMLAHGSGTVAVIARNAKLERPLVYRVLPELMEMGFIAKAIKGKRAIYTALPPTRLRERWSELGGALEEALPALTQAHDRIKNVAGVKHFEGKHGIVAVYDDIVNALPPGATFYRYSSGSTPRKRNHYVSKDYAARRDEKKLERFVITNKATALGKKTRLERAVKVVPQGADLFSYDITEIIYGDKIAFVDYNTETATVIENKIIAQFQTRLFKLLYQRL